MKKKRLLKTVFATALTWMVCATGAWASTTDYTNKMSSDKSAWTNATNTYGTGGVERYNGNDNAFAVGNVLYQTISDLPNGYYEVEFYAWENFSNWNDQANIGYADGKAQVFANVSVEDIYVIKNTGGRDFNDANKYKLLTSVTEGTLVYGVKNIAAGGNWAVCKPISLTYLGSIIDDNSDLTSAISNPSFETGYLTGWSIPKYSSDTQVCTPDGNHATTGADGTYIFNTWWQGVPLTQTIGNLPIGKYKLTASIAGSDSGADAKIFLIGNGTHSDVITIPAGTSGTFSDYDYTFYLTGTSTTIGIVGGNDAGEYVADGHWWYKTDNFRLTYLGITVEAVAEALPTGNMTADKWYYFDALTAGDYNFSTINNIVYTTDGTQLASSATTSTWTSTTQVLTEGRYYVKSSTAQTLTVAPANYTYTVGSATSSHAYVQAGQTVTVTWSEAFTNNTSATFAKNGNPSVTFGGTAVTVTETTNGFTFTVPTVTAGTDYTLSIPANAFGYAAGSTYNAAQNITFKTPVLFDQTAFLKDSGSGLYLARGLAWGTRAYLDEYGIATQIATDAEGYTSITFVDTDCKLYYDGNDNMWCDSRASGDDTKWVVTLNNGKYRLTGKSKIAGTDFVKYDQSDASRNLWANITNVGGENIIGWTLVSASDYATAMTSLKNSQASTAATAAGTSAATPDALATAVSGWNQTKVITGSTPTEAKEKYQQGQTDPAPIAIVSNEVTITTPGLYKFSIQAFYRMRGNNENYTLHTQGFDLPAAYVFFGNAKTQIASVFDHAESSAYSSQDYANSNNHYPDGTASALTAFIDGNYTNTIWTYISQSDIDAATDGKFTYGIKYEGWPNYISEWKDGKAVLGAAQWSCWTVESVDLTLYSQDLWPSLQAALRTYAPYSDVTDVTGYTTQYNTYAAYTQSTSQSDMQTAITYMQNNYANYQWANASIAHPVDVTEGIISGWECTTNDAWPGSGRSTATGTYYDGTNRTYFTQNHEDGAARSQSVTIPEVGAYMLRTIVRPVADASFATITIGSESTSTRGIQTGGVNIGNGWAYNDIYFATTEANANKSISIALSNVNNGREADCGEMHLYYIGQSADFVKDGVHKYIGTFASAPALEVTDAVPVVDVTLATFTSGTSAVTFTNPNGLVFVATDGQTSADKNEVIGNTCATLQLADGHPFMNPTQFTATSASYTMSAIASGKNANNEDISFGTLMLPFNATLPSGTAYILDQGVNLIDGNVRGTTTASIAANTPVLVTASGDYTGSDVTVPVVASGATYTNGELVGTYTAMTAIEGSYVLQNHTSGEGVAFYLVGSTKPTVNPFRAYIKPQGSSVKAISVMFDEDGIQTMDNGQWTMDNAEIFNLSGQRLSKPQRGVNIINGKKVVVK